MRCPFFEVPLFRFLDTFNPVQFPSILILLLAEISPIFPLVGFRQTLAAGDAVEALPLYQCAFLCIPTRVALERQKQKAMIFFEVRPHVL